MPHNSGTPDRIVHNDSGGGGGSDTNATIVAPLPLPASVADGADVNAGSTTDVAETSDSDGTLSGKLRGLVKWAFERMPASLGQKLMATSFPVTIASDQSAVPVNATSLPTFGAGQGTYEEDTAHTTGDRGEFVLGVRNAFNGTTFTDLVGDYSPIAVGQYGEVLTQGIETRTEDSGHLSTDYGAFVLAVRNDADIVVTNADRDYSAISVDSAGRLKVAPLPDGTSNIGDVDVLTLPAGTVAGASSLPAGNNNIGDVDVASIAAGTTLIGGTYTVCGQLIDENGVVCTVKRASIALTAAGNGNTTVVSAVAGKKIRVLGIHISCNDGANHIANFTDGAGGASIFPFLVATAPLSHNFAPTTGAWLCETTSNTALVLNLSENVTFLHGVVVYIEV